MKRNELLKSPVYWTTELQMELYRQIEDFNLNIIRPFRSPRTII